MKFKIGDKVKVIPNSQHHMAISWNNWMSDKKLKFLTIVKVRNDRYGFKENNSCSGDFVDTHFVLYDDKMRELKKKLVGD